MNETIRRKLLERGWLGPSVHRGGYQWTRMGLSKVVLVKAAIRVCPDMRRRLVDEAFSRCEEPVLSFWQACLELLQIDEARDVVDLLETIETAQRQSPPETPPPVVRVPSDKANSLR